MPYLLGGMSNIGAELYAEAAICRAQNHCVKRINCGKTIENTGFYAESDSKMKKACISKPLGKK